MLSARITRSARSLSVSIWTVGGFNAVAVRSVAGRPPPTPHVDDTHAYALGYLAGWACGWLFNWVHAHSRCCLSCNFSPWTAVWRCLCFYSQFPAGS